MKTEVKKKLIVLINSKVSNIKTKSAQKTERKPEQQKNTLSSKPFCPPSKFHEPILKQTFTKKCFQNVNKNYSSLNRPTHRIIHK